MDTLRTPSSHPLTLPYPPSANRYWRHVGRLVLLSREARAFKKQVAAICTAQRVQPLAGPVSVFVEAFRPRRVGDLDNTLKVALDALQGFCYADDSQVVAIHAFRHDDKARPRLEVWAVPFHAPPVSAELPPPTGRCTASDATQAAATAGSA